VAIAEVLQSSGDVEGFVGVDGTASGGLARRQVRQLAALIRLGGQAGKGQRPIP
jgi:hypothetical protein